MTDQAAKSKRDKEIGFFFTINFLTALCVAIATNNLFWGAATFGGFILLGITLGGISEQLKELNEFLKQKR